MNKMESTQGLLVDGGGEKKGMVGIPVGRGGSVTLGIVGSVGSTVGFGKDGICVLGKGGNVGFGRAAAAAAVGNVGKGGSVTFGSVGIAGNGGIVTLGRGGTDGIVGNGEVCSKWRAARLTWIVLESDNAMIKDNIKECARAAIVSTSRRELKKGVQLLD